MLMSERRCNINCPYTYREIHKQLAKIFFFFNSVEWKVFNNYKLLCFDVILTKYNLQEWFNFFSWKILADLVMPFLEIQK